MKIPSINEYGDDNTFVYIYYRQFLLSIHFNRYIFIIVLSVSLFTEHVKYYLLLKSLVNH